MASRCGRYAWSLGVALNDVIDQWPVCDIPTLFSFFFSATSRSIINPTLHLMFSKNVFVCYFCPFLSTKLFWQNSNVMTVVRCMTGKSI